MDTHAQRLGDKLAAGRAPLGRVPGVHENHTPPSFCRFGNGHLNELRPGHIQDAFAHPATSAQLHRSQILKHDHLIGIHQFTALLVGEVAAPVGNPHVDTGQDGFLLGVLEPVLRQLGRVLAPLDTLQVGLIAPMEARVRDLLPVGERSKRRQSHIHTHYGVRWRQRRGLGLAREAGEPRAGTRAGERDRLGRALQRSVQDDMHRADLREDESRTLQAHAISILGIGEAIVATEALEARETDCFGSRLHPPKEGLKSQIDSYADILEHLGMDKLHGRARQLPDREEVQRIVLAQRLAAFRIRPLAFGKQFVIHPAAFFKLLLKDAPLALREVDAVFESFAHGFHSTLTPHT